MLQFRTPEVAALYEEVGRYGHAENPFLAPHYSIGGYYPVTDFTSVIAVWLQTECWQAIGELWTRITTNWDRERAMLQMAMAANVIPELCLDDETAAEAKAVYLLGSRLSLYATGHDPVTFQVGRLLASRLASILWEPPAEVLRHLRAGAETEARVIPGYDPPGRKRELAEAAMAALLTPLSESDRNVGEWMLRIPPMARLVVADYFERDRGSLRPELYYGERHYGNCATINRAFVKWVGCFDAANDATEVPHLMSKAHLATALHGAGVAVKPSWSKVKLIAEARRHEGLLSSIFAEHFPDVCVVKPEWNAPLRRWAERCRALPPIALAILKSLALQSSRVRLGG
jgi:hypothetical protein